MYFITFFFWFSCWEQTVPPIPIQTAMWNKDFWSELRKFFHLSYKLVAQQIYYAYYS
jgi:hypothetical protein